MPVQAVGRRPKRPTIGGSLLPKPSKRSWRASMTNKCIREAAHLPFIHWPYRITEAAWSPIPILIPVGVSRKFSQKNPMRA